MPFKPASRPATWTRVPYASLLPTRWTAVGWLGSERAQDTGIEITGPVLGRAGIPSEGGQAMPRRMQFFGPAEDVGTAENIGMGLRLPLTADMQQNGLDLLLVYGVDESGDAGAVAQALSELFDAHFYSDGFSYTTPAAPRPPIPGTSAPAWTSAPRPIPTATASRPATSWPRTADLGGHAHRRAGDLSDGKR